METNQKIAVGLDIGTTKIVAIVGKKNEHGKIEILGHGKSKSLGVHRGVVSNITLTINSIQEAIQEAERSSGIKINEVVVGIAGQHIRSLQHNDYIIRKNSEEVIEEKDIDELIDQVHKLVMLPGEEIIHVLPQEFKVDGQSEIKGKPIGMYGTRLEANFHVVVGHITSIKNIARCVKSAGLTMSAITLEPLASSEACLSKEEKEAGVALIDIGGGTTDVAIIKDDTIRHTAVIPFGGNIVTEDIKEACSIIERQAELLKIRYGSAWPGENSEHEVIAIPGLKGREPKQISFKNLSQIINSRMQEILEQANMEIRNYGSDEQRKKLIAGIVLTGGGSNLKHIRQLTEHITGMDVRKGVPNEYLAGNSDIEFLSSPEFATGVGLLMKGLEQPVKHNPIYDEKTHNTAIENNHSVFDKPIAQVQLEKQQQQQTEEPKTEEPKIEEIKKPKFRFSDWGENLLKRLFNDPE